MNASLTKYERRMNSSTTVTANLTATLTAKLAKAHSL